jgi:sec-independent protein translocase protein TatA
MKTNGLPNMMESLAFLPNLGPTEMIIIFVLVMLLFGAKKIPELARGIGKSLGEFKKAKNDFEKELSLGEKEGTSSASKQVKSPASES